ncbi:hypothetical protein Q5P01_017635 [Channa striata]|uniref:Uncharacterized protein n=1 Tax=Channa striata TaxID=64152 RepID=A0AA88MBX0_CHASR|nr:hypothetical protein Q5P01_017635 [Channa striata]
MLSNFRQDSRLRQPSLGSTEDPSAPDPCSSVISPSHLLIQVHATISVLLTMQAPVCSVPGLRCCSHVWTVGGAGAANESRRVDPCRLGFRSPAETHVGPDRVRRSNGNSSVPLR